MSRLSVKYRGPLKGVITPPPDKSISHRAVILASIANGKSAIRNFLRAEDPLRTLNAFRMMGIKTEEDPHSGDLIIHGKGLYGLSAPGDVIDCGNSGTTMRLLSGVLAGQPFTSILTGDQYLLKRPMQRIIDPLTEMGAAMGSEKGGLPPLHVRGGDLKSIAYNSPIASAQVKSAVLLAGLYCDGITSVIEPGKSRDHTETMLRAAGVEVNEVGQKVSVKGIATLNPVEITVPGDFSSAAFFIVAGLLIPGSEILIKNVGINPTRSGLMSILQDMMDTHIELLNVRTVSGETVADIGVQHSRLKGINIGSHKILKAIDEFPIICIAAAKADGSTKITGARELRVKESDRIASMASELRKMGVSVEELEDGIIIEGKENLSPAHVQSYGDHRIAMSMYIAALATDGETVIEDTDCMNTSFPAFVEMIDTLIDKG